MTAMIEAGAAGVRFEDQLSPGGARADLGEKVLVPTGQHIETLTAARLAADVLGVPSLIIARSGANAASLLTSDIDERDHEFLTGERTADGFHRVEPGWYAYVTRELAFAPYADVLWLQTPAPDLAVARAFACIIHSQYPDKPLAYSCPPPSTGLTHQDGASIAKFQTELAAMGYQFQSAIPAGVRRSGGTVARTRRPAHAQPRTGLRLTTTSRPRPDAFHVHHDPVVPSGRTPDLLHARDCRYSRLPGHDLFGVVETGRAMGGGCADEGAVAFSQPGGWLGGGGAARGSRGQARRVAIPWLVGEASGMNADRDPVPLDQGGERTVSSAPRVAGRQCRM